MKNILLFIISFFITFQTFAHDISMTNYGGAGSGYGAEGCPGSGNNGPRFGETNRLKFADPNGIAEQVYAESARIFASSASGLSESIRQLSQAKTMFQEQINRRNSLRQSVVGTEYQWQKERVLDAASESMQTTKDYLFARDYEGAAISSSVTNTLLDFVTSFTPGVSWARDLFEAITGKDLINGEDLGNFSRTMAVMGTVSFGLANKATKAFDVIQKLTRTEAKLPFDMARKLYDGKPLSEVKATLAYFKRHKFWDLEDTIFKNFVTAFEMKTTKVTILAEDIKAYRYYDPKYTKPRGNWLTPDMVDNPEMKLALKHPGNYKYAEWTIPKGTEVIEGRVAAKDWGTGLKPGGGYQIFIHDKDLLK